MSSVVAPANAAAPFADPTGGVAAGRAIFVPSIAICVDLGMPLLLLLLSFLVLGHRRRAAAARATAPQCTVGKVSLCVLDVTPPSVLEEAEEKSHPGFITRFAAWVQGQRSSLRGVAAAQASAAEVERRLGDAAVVAADDLLATLKTAETGLSAEEAAVRLAQHGPNRMKSAPPPSSLSIVMAAIIQPFNLLLVGVAVLTISPPNSDWRTFTLIMVLLIIAIVVRLYEEFQNVVSAAALLVHSSANTRVRRAARVSAWSLGGGPFEGSDEQATVNVDTMDLLSAVSSGDALRQAGTSFTVERVDLCEVVPGDVVELAAGDLLPGDVRLLADNSLHVGESALTGEPMPVHKEAMACSSKTAVLEHANLCFAGTYVASGTATAVVLSTGDSTFIASIARALAARPELNAFDRAIRRIVYLFILFIVVMVPIVIGLNGWTTGDYHAAAVFGLAVAVGLTPQMLPMIVTTNLARGAALMRKARTVVRRLDAVQSLGAMDILCTDKTGTLTIDTVTLVTHADPQLRTSQEVFRLAFANSFFQASPVNPMDQGIRSFAEANAEANQLGAAEVAAWVKVDEVPFDFQRRRLSVVLRAAGDAKAKPMLICKGALEEMLALCDHEDCAGTVAALDDASRARILAAGNTMNEEGLRVLGVATRTFTKAQDSYGVQDEDGMLFKGFLAFLDPLKESAGDAVRDLAAKGVAVKVLTGDSAAVARRICRSLGIDATHCVEGGELAKADDATLAELVNRCSIFAKVAPQQKAAVVAALQASDHVVGFLGDGTNDALALRKADVGVSVDSGTDVAKEAAGIVLLEKDLGVLSAGVTYGRITYGNTIKYIKFASSSSFGNTFSILASAAWLPFTPVAPIQVLLLNLLYNISQMAIPWDTMDPSFLMKPKRWSAKFLGLYMLIVGPISSIFDICTYLTLWYYYGLVTEDDGPAFQSGWFIESLLTQTFIVHLLRTERWPFLQSRAAWPLQLSSFSTMAAGIAICYIPGLSGAFQLTHVPPSFYGFLTAIIACYCLMVQFIKFCYIRVFNAWL
ncbi:hypothetical protein WJX81_005045 [Elliptochloris bilobata]|uniref:Magnesium-transporting ATPase, P-type 1 n=1 Tax=Elliptochloris bilobata TaxID=381761 RepID=A0AAW1SKW2_9CHLO